LKNITAQPQCAHQYLPAEDIEFLHRKSGALDEVSSRAGSSSTTLSFALRHAAEMLAGYASQLYASVLGPLWRMPMNTGMDSCTRRGSSNYWRSVSRSWPAPGKKKRRFHFKNQPLGMDATVIALWYRRLIGCNSGARRDCQAGQVQLEQKREED
jgi:hypothetical protein